MEQYSRAGQCPPGIRPGCRHGLSKTLGQNRVDEDYPSNRNQDLRRRLFFISIKKSPTSVRSTVAGKAETVVPPSPKLRTIKTYKHSFPELVDSIVRLFILGCAPLMPAFGSGAASRSTMWIGFVYGMTIAISAGLFLIPDCYVFVQRIIEHGGKKSVWLPSLRKGGSMIPKETRQIPAGRKKLLWAATICSR